MSRVRPRRAGRTAPQEGPICNTMHAHRTLDLAPPLLLSVGRIGYPDEGLRLTISRGMPFDYASEVKLSRADCAWLVACLQHALATMDNLP